MTITVRKCSGVFGHGECGCDRVECDLCGYAQDFANPIAARLAAENHECEEER